MIRLVLLALAVWLISVPALAAPAPALVKAADRGDAASQYVLGSLYARGEGVPRDYKKALKLYTMAAEKGNPYAQTNLGFFYDAGIGVDARDPAAAFKWYEKAAMQGDAISQANLGSLYARGEGTTQNYIEAYFWFTLAATHGSGVTVAAARDSIARHLTPAGLELVQNRAAAWKPQKKGE